MSPADFFMELIRNCVTTTTHHQGDTHQSRAELCEIFKLASHAETLDTLLSIVSTLHNVSQTHRDLVLLQPTTEQSWSKKLILVSLFKLTWHCNSQIIHTLLTFGEKHSTQSEMWSASHSSTQPCPAWETTRELVKTFACKHFILTISSDSRCIDGVITVRWKIFLFSQSWKYFLCCAWVWGHHIFNNIC